MQYASFESYISEWGYCLNAQLTHKNKYHNDIDVVALNILGCWATTENKNVAAL